MRARLPALLCLLPALCGCGASPAPPDPFAAASRLPGTLSARLIHFTVDGSPASPYLNPASGEIHFQFSGSMHASDIDAATGEILGAHDTPLGRFGPAVVAFRIHPEVPASQPGFMTFRCIRCRISFTSASDAGAVLKALSAGNDGDFPDPVEADDITRTLSLDVPFQGRFLQHFGPVRPGSGPGIGIGIRGAGCGGTQEVRGRGAIAGQRGSICMNGQFDFAAGDLNALGTLLTRFNGQADATDVASLLQWLAGAVLHGESDCPLMLHAATGDG